MSSNLTGTEGPQPSDIPEVEIPPVDFVAGGKNLGVGLSQSGWDDKLLQKITDHVRQWLAAGLGFFLKYIFQVLGFALRVLTDGTNNAEESLAELSTIMINHLLGVKVATDAVKMRRNGEPTHPDIETLGTLVMQRFMAAFDDGGSIEPGDAAAKKFVNRAIAMSVDGWALDAIIDWFPHEILDFDKLASLDDKLRQAMGLGRMTRAVLHPAINILAVTPYTWKLNKQYRPKLLSDSQAVEQFLRGNWTDAELREELAREGWSDKRIDALIQEHTKLLSLEELAFLERYSGWPRANAIGMLRAAGWSEALADLRLNIVKSKELQAIKHECALAAAAAFVRRDIEVDQFMQILSENIADDDLRHQMQVSAATRRELNVTYLSEGQAEQAIILGFWNIQQYTDHLKRKGFSDDDILTMQLLVQEKLAHASDVQSKKDAAAKAHAAAAAAKAAAAKARQAQLDAQRAHKDLSIGQVHRAVVRGELTISQYHDFLVRDGQAQEDIAVLLGLVQAEQAQYAAAAAKRAKADTKLAVTSLTSAQLEKAVETGAMTIDDYQQILAAQGVASGDIAILLDAVRTNVQARADAEARRLAIAAKLEHKGISLSQFEAAVRHGLRSMADFKQFLADNHYGIPDQASIVGLLQARIDADTAAAALKTKVAAALGAKHIPVAALEQAVRRGLRPIADYRAALTSSGVIPGDVDTLVALLQGQMDDATAAAARKAANTARLAAKGISLANLERAARLGIIPVARYQAALAAENLPAEDQDVMVALLSADIARTQAAQQKAADAEAKLRNRPVPLADLKHGVLLGIRPIGDYQLELQTAGYDADAQDALVKLLQDEIDQKKAADARKAELDAKRSEKEVSRAQFEAAVKAGIKTIDDYAAFLQELGYGDEDQALLLSLLSGKLS